MRLATVRPSKTFVYGSIAWASAIAFGIASVLNIALVLAVVFGVVGKD